MNLNNFLTSGHAFGDNEYELKSKFILMNSAIAIILLFIMGLTFILFIRGDLNLAISNVIYIFFGLFSLYFIRRKKNHYKIIIPLIPVISIGLLTVAIIEYPMEHVRISWFLVIIIFAFFIGGSKLGFLTSIASILSILSIDYFIDMGLNTYTRILIMAIIFLGSILVNFYEKRELFTKRKLYILNENLEKSIKVEISKRLSIYEKSNVKLQNSAKMLEEQKDAYKYLAHYDILTGLSNRILFYDKLEQAIYHAKQTQTKLAVLFLDLDNFKEINDSFGHNAGDDVLKIIAERFKNKIDKPDSLARLGGDEFTVLLEGCEDNNVIGNISENLIEVLNEPIYILEHELYVTVSIGVSVYPDDGKDVATLLKHADSAMYSAKKNGCNLYHFYKQEMTNQALERVTLETKMRNALDNDEFIVYYQPMVNGRTGELIGLEALVRWQHPEKGFLTPDKFIHFAESTSIIVPLGERVLEIVSAQVRSWHSLSFNPFISVNLSINQLRHKSLIPFIKNILEQTKFRSNWLEFEITEGYAMQNPEQSIAVLNEIKALGVKLSIDDFGTGYSSLAHLKKLPVDKLKIDKSFISDLPEDEDDKALVAAVVSMAKNMNLDVIAEGVETEAQKIFLQNIGCMKMQGYFFEKPISVQRIDEIYIKK